jgi:hypothetical protein
LAEEEIESLGGIPELGQIFTQDDHDIGADLLGFFDQL